MRLSWEAGRLLNYALILTVLGFKNSAQLHCNKPYCFLYDRLNLPFRFILQKELLVYFW